MPDFGYGTQNSIINLYQGEADPSMYWNVVGSFLENTTKFQTMLNHIKLTKMKDQQQKLLSDFKQGALKEQLEPTQANATVVRQSVYKRPFKTKGKQ